MIKQKYFQMITGVSGFLVFFTAFWILPVVFDIPSDDSVGIILYPIAITLGVLAFMRPLYSKMGMKK